MLYKLIAIFGYFMMFWFISEGISLISSQKTFDIIGILFYPEPYKDVDILDLTPAPYWVSFTLGLFLILFPIWSLIKYKLENS